MRRVKIVEAGAELLPVRRGDEEGALWIRAGGWRWLWSLRQKYSCWRDFAYGFCCRVLEPEIPTGRVYVVRPEPSDLGEFGEILRKTCWSISDTRGAVLACLRQIARKCLEFLKILL
jgi:hypothetical protein